MKLSGFSRTQQHLDSRPGKAVRFWEFHAYRSIPDVSTVPKVAKCLNLYTPSAAP